MAVSDLAMRSGDPPASRGPSNISCVRRFCGLVVVVALAVPACEGFSEPISVHVQNDLRQTIAFGACTSKDCSHTQDRWVLRPGEIGEGLVEAKAGYNSYIV